MRRRRSPFIGGEEGVIWKMVHPLMEGTKPISNRPQDAFNLAGHLRNRLCNVGGRYPTKDGLEMRL